MSGLRARTTPQNHNHSHRDAADALPPSTSGILRRYLEPQVQRVVLVFGCLLAAIGLELWAPLILRWFIDTATNGVMGVGLLLYIAALFIGVSLGARAIRIAMTYLSEQVGWEATNRLRNDLARHCLGLDMSFHHARTPGELIESVDGDVTALARLFSEFTVQVAGGVAILLGILCLLFIQDYRVGLVFSLFAVAAFLLLQASRDFSVPKVVAEREARTELAGFLEERFAGLEDIRTSGGAAYALRRHAEISNELATRGTAAATAGRAVWVLTAGIFVAGSITALAIGIYLFHRGEATIGTVFLYVQYMGMTRAPLNQIGHQLQQVQRAVASLGRIRALLAQRPSIESGRREPGNGAPGLVFERVDFDYAEGSATLRDISFSLAPGEVLGLLGHTGSGKTSLTRLICRLYEAKLGRILLGGVRLEDFDLRALRGAIGMVTQNVQLFSGSVRDNVRLFDPSIRDGAILGVLESVGLSQWLERLPRGLDSRLTGASGLSAGEAQLLAFARVFLKNPGLVILDEPSSRLDPATDLLIESAIDRLLRPAADVQRTAIVIAHKLSTVARADRIVILRGGRIIESGERATLAADAGSELSALLERASDGILA